MTWKHYLALSSLALLISCSRPSPPARDTDAEILREVVESYWGFVFENDIELRVKYGADIEELPDVSFAKGRECLDAARRHLERLEEVRPEALDHEDWVLFEVLRWDLELEIERVEHFWHWFSVTPRAVRNSFVPELYQAFELGEPEDLDTYLRLLRKLPNHVEAQLAKLHGQIERGILVPKAAIDLLLPIWRHIATPGDESPFRVSKSRLADLAAGHPDEVRAFEAEMERILETEVEPATKRLADYLAGEYYDLAPETVGFGQYPGGAEYYRYIAKRFTTLEMPPREIHELGLARAAEISAEMDEVRRSTGFEGSRDEFHRYLMTDPRFLARSPEDLEARLRSFIAKIEPKLDDYFSKKPRAPYGVKRLPAAYEAGVTYGYYRPPSESEPTGYFRYNGSKLDERPLFPAESLIYHELVPGHHMQVALQDENETLPIYHRNNFYSAHAEGWAVYASQLAREMGMYEDPYFYYGRLSSELRYAVRLVVDTGMNALGWTRQEAIDYMRENTLESEAQIASETLRYAADLPGQALAYKIGADKIRELRRRAEEELGERFDVRRFHDAILDWAPMPMKVLEAHIEWFIEREKGRARR